MVWGKIVVRTVLYGRHVESPPRAGFAHRALRSRGYDGTMVRRTGHSTEPTVSRILWLGDRERKKRRAHGIFTGVVRQEAQCVHGPLDRILTDGEYDGTGSVNSRSLPEAWVHAFELCDEPQEMVLHRSHVARLRLSDGPAGLSVMRMPSVAGIMCLAAVESVTFANWPDRPPITENAAPERRCGDPDSRGGTRTRDPGIMSAVL